MLAPLVLPSHPIPSAAQQAQARGSKEGGESDVDPTLHSPVKAGDG